MNKGLHILRFIETNSRTNDFKLKRAFTSRHQIRQGHNIAALSSSLSVTSPFSAKTNHQNSTTTTFNSGIASCDWKLHVMGLVLTNQNALLHNRVVMGSELRNLFMTLAARIAHSTEQVMVIIQ